MAASLKNMRFLPKLLLAFGTVIAMLLSVSAITWKAVSFIQVSIGETLHTYEVIGAVDRTLVAMVNQESGLRGYVLTGEDRHLTLQRQGREAFEKALDEVLRLTRDDPDQQDRLTKLNRSARGWEGNVADKQIALMQDPSTRGEARAMDLSGVAKQYMDAIRVKAAPDQGSRDRTPCGAADGPGFGV